MRIKGIYYDTGIVPGGHLTRSTLEANDVRQDMQLIAGDLGCKPHRNDPEFDLDLASFGVVAILEDERPAMRLRPKQSFAALAGIPAHARPGRILSRSK